jgi:hypothetical protein
VVERILSSGKDVVTPLGWFYPPAGERGRLDAVARAAGVTLHGTGFGQSVRMVADELGLRLDPPWTFGPEGERFEIEITGDPSCLVTFHELHPETVEAGLERNPGIVATAVHCVNAIPYVCVAGPRLPTYLDLPLVARRAAISLGTSSRR